MTNSAEYFAELGGDEPINFENVFMVSALNGTGIQPLKVRFAGMLLVQNTSTQFQIPVPPFVDANEYGCRIVKNYIYDNFKYELAFDIPYLHSTYMY